MMSLPARIPEPLPAAPRARTRPSAPTGVLTARRTPRAAPISHVVVAAAADVATAAVPGSVAAAAPRDHTFRARPFPPHMSACIYGRCFTHKCTRTPSCPCPCNVAKCSASIPLRRSAARVPTLRGARAQRPRRRRHRRRRHRRPVIHRLPLQQGCSAHACCPRSRKRGRVVAGSVAAVGRAPSARACACPVAPHCPWADTLLSRATRSTPPHPASRRRTRLRTP